MDKGAWLDAANPAEECGSVCALARVAAARLCYSHTNYLITAPATPCTTLPSDMSCHRARREHVSAEGRTVVSYSCSNTGMTLRRALCRVAEEDVVSSVRNPRGVECAFILGS